MPSNTFNKNINFKNRKFNAAVESVYLHNSNKKSIIDKEGSTDDKELALERYNDYPAYVDYTPSNLSSEIVRSNKYMRVNYNYLKLSLNELPFFYDVELNSIYEVVGTSIQNKIFLINNKPSIFINKKGDNIYDNKDTDLFDICDEYILDLTPNGNKAGTAILKSMYFKEDLHCDVYTNESIKNSDGDYYVFIDSNACSTVKYYSPIRRSIKLSDDKITKVRINDVLILETINNKTVYGEIENQYSIDKKSHLSFGNGRININMTLGVDERIINIPYKVELYVNGKWIERSLVDRITIPYKEDNIKVTVPETIYFNVPFEFNFYVNRSDLYSNLYVDKIKLHFNGTQKTLNCEFISTKNSIDQYRTSNVILESTADNDKEFKITYLLNGEYNGIPGIFNGIGWGIENINPVPDSYLEITYDKYGTYSIIENTNSTFDITYKAAGTLDINTIELVKVKDSNEYFLTNDFKLTKTTNGFKISTSKIHSHPDKELTGKLTLKLNYMCSKKDGSPVRWPSEDIIIDYTIKFVEDRYLIEYLESDSELKGNVNFYFKIKDTLLNDYTNYYSLDETLVLRNNIIASGIVNGDYPLLWDKRKECWFISANIITFGEFSIVYKEKYTASNNLLIKHLEPEHYIKTVVHSKNLDHLTTTRIVIDLSYNDLIDTVIVDGKTINYNTPFKIDKYFLNNEYYISPIKNPYNSAEIIGLGVDLTNNVKDGIIPIEFNITGINFNDFTNWPKKVKIEYKLNYDTFTMVLDKLNDKEDRITVSDKTLNNSLIDCVLKVGTITLSKPLFKPKGNGVFVTNELVIPDEYKNDKNLYLEVLIKDYDYGRSSDQPIIKIYSYNIWINK